MPRFEVVLLVMVLQLILAEGSYNVLGAGGKGACVVEGSSEISSGGSVLDCQQLCDATAGCVAMDHTQQGVTFMQVPANRCTLWFSAPSGASCGNLPPVFCTSVCYEKAAEPTAFPTKSPTRAPTESPTNAPSKSPTRTPTDTPTKAPTKAPTLAPTKTPTLTPTETPTSAPTKSPTKAPTRSPTRAPTESPTKIPSKIPTNAPTKTPTLTPTETPTSAPTKSPTKAPTKSPTRAPTESPTKIPSKIPTNAPTKTPTRAPTETPTTAPTKTPTNSPTKTPTNAPTKTPTNAPTKTPTKAPTRSPCDDGSHSCDTAGGGVCYEDKTSSQGWSCDCAIGFFCVSGCDGKGTHACEAVTNSPTRSPTNTPSRSPTSAPSSSPTTDRPMFSPTIVPTNPTSAPTATPTSIPTSLPTATPSSVPTFSASGLQGEILSATNVAAGSVSAEERSDILTNIGNLMVSLNQPGLRGPSSSEANAAHRKDLINVLVAVSSSGKQGQMQTSDDEVLQLNQSPEELEQTAGILGALTANPDELTQETQDTALQLANAVAQSALAAGEITESTRDFVGSTVSSLLDASTFSQPPTKLADSNSSAAESKAMQKARAKRAHRVMATLGSLAQASLKKKGPNAEVALTTKNFRMRAKKQNNPHQRVRSEFLREAFKFRDDDRFLSESSENGQSVTTQSTWFDTDLYGGTSSQTLNAKVTTADGVSIPVTQLDEPLQFTVSQRKLSNSSVDNSDPRLNGYCNYWDEDNNDWNMRGVFTLGIENTGSYPVLCATMHLTAFTSNGNLQSPSSDVLNKNPSVIQRYTWESALIPFFLVAWVIVVVYRLLSLRCRDNNPNHKYEVWRAAALSFLQYGEVNSGKYIVRRMGFLQQLQYRLRTQHLWSVASVPVEELFCHNHSTRLLCIVVNVFMTMTALVLLYDTDQTEDDNSFLQLSRGERSMGQTLLEQIWRAMWVAVMVLPLNALFPAVIMLARNHRSLTLQRNDKLREAIEDSMDIGIKKSLQLHGLRESSLEWKSNQVTPESTKRTVSAPITGLGLFGARSMGMTELERVQKLLAVRGREFKALIQADLKNNWSINALIVTAVLVCAECALIILTFGVELSQAQTAGWLAGVATFVLFDTFISFPCLILMYTLLERYAMYRLDAQKAKRLNQMRRDFPEALKTTGFGKKVDLAQELESAKQFVENRQGHSKTNSSDLADEAERLLGLIFGEESAKASTSRNNGAISKVLGKEGINAKDKRSALILDCQVVKASAVFKEVDDFLAERIGKRKARRRHAAIMDGGMWVRKMSQDRTFHSVLARKDSTGNDEHRTSNASNGSTASMNSTSSMANNDVAQSQISTIDNPTQWDALNLDSMDDLEAEIANFDHSIKVLQQQKAAARERLQAQGQQRFKQDFRSWPQNAHEKLPEEYVRSVRTKSWKLARDQRRTQVEVSIENSIRMSSFKEEKDKTKSVLTLGTKTRVTESKRKTRSDTGRRGQRPSGISTWEQGSVSDDIQPGPTLDISIPEPSPVIEIQSFSESLRNSPRRPHALELGRWEQESDMDDSVSNLPMRDPAHHRPAAAAAAAAAENPISQPLEISQWEDESNGSTFDGFMDGATQSPPALEIRIPQPVEISQWEHDSEATSEDNNDVFFDHLMDEATTEPNVASTSFWDKKRESIGGDIDRPVSGESADPFHNSEVLGGWQQDSDEPDSEETLGGNVQRDFASNDDDADFDIDFIEQSLFDEEDDALMF